MRPAAIRQDGGAIWPGESGCSTKCLHRSPVHGGVMLLGFGYAWLSRRGRSCYG